MSTDHRVLGRLLDAAERCGCAHLVLVDPDRTTPERSAELARECAMAGTDGILFGSSTPLERDPAPVLRAIRRDGDDSRGGERGRALHRSGPPAGAGPPMMRSRGFGFHEGDA